MATKEPSKDHTSHDSRTSKFDSASTKKAWKGFGAGANAFTPPTSQCLCRGSKQDTCGKGHPNGGQVETGPAQGNKVSWRPQHTASSSLQNQVSFAMQSNMADLFTDWSNPRQAKHSTSFWDFATFGSCHQDLPHASYGLQSEPKEAWSQYTRSHTSWARWWFWDSASARESKATEESPRTWSFETAICSWHHFSASCLKDHLPPQSQSSKQMPEKWPKDFTKNWWSSQASLASTEGPVSMVPSKPLPSRLKRQILLEVILLEVPRLVPDIAFPEEHLKPCQPRLIQATEGLNTPPVPNGRITYDLSKPEWKDLAPVFKCRGTANMTPMPLQMLPYLVPVIEVNEVTYVTYVSLSTVTFDPTAPPGRLHVEPWGCCQILEQSKARLPRETQRSEELRLHAENPPEKPQPKGNPKGRPRGRKGASGGYLTSTLGGPWWKKGPKSPLVETSATPECYYGPFWTERVDFVICEEWEHDEPSRERSQSRERGATSREPTPGPGHYNAEHPAIHGRIPGRVPGFPKVRRNPDIRLWTPEVCWECGLFQGRWTSLSCRCAEAC